jgi:hypothetical protein
LLGISAPNKQAFWACFGKAWYQAGSVPGPGRPGGARPMPRTVVDLVVTGIDRSRGAPERILSDFLVLSIHICSLRLRSVIWTLLSIVTIFQPHSASHQKTSTL